MTLTELIQQCEDDRIPYTEKIVCDNIVIRYFNSSVQPHLLKWHWDAEDRIIEALNENDWQFQFDNELPIKLTPGIAIKIHEGVYHRIIKGTSDLIVKVNKLT